VLVAKAKDPNGRFFPAVGIEGHHVKTCDVRMLGKALPKAADREGAQVHAVQGDRLGGHGDGTAFPVEFECAKLVLQLAQVSDESGDVRDEKRRALQDLPGPTNRDRAPHAHPDSLEQVR
jgi:hypothetical protein